MLRVGYDGGGGGGSSGPALVIRFCFGYQEEHSVAYLEYTAAGCPLCPASLALMNQMRTPCGLFHSKMVAGVGEDVPVSVAATSESFL